MTWKAKDLYLGKETGKPLSPHKPVLGLSNGGDYILSWQHSIKSFKVLLMVIIVKMFVSISITEHGCVLLDCRAAFCSTVYSLLNNH